MGQLFVQAGAERRYPDHGGLSDGGLLDLRQHQPAVDLLYAIVDPRLRATINRPA
jgi:ABC-type dipeptide/oligopeptide/nickel transport system permease component